MESFMESYHTSWFIFQSSSSWIGDTHLTYNNYFPWSFSGNFSHFIFLLLNQQKSFYLEKQTTNLALRKITYVADKKPRNNVPVKALINSGTSCWSESGTYRTQVKASKTKSKHSGMHMTRCIIKRLMEATVQRRHLLTKRSKTQKKVWADKGKGSNSIEMRFPPSKNLHLEWKTYFPRNTLIQSDWETHTQSKFLVISHIFWKICCKRKISLTDYLQSMYSSSINNSTVNRKRILFQCKVTIFFPPLTFYTVSLYRRVL